MQNLIWQPLYKEIEKQISRGEKVLLLFSPFIKLNPLKLILASCKHTADIKIVVRWQPRDIIFGVSDLNIYPFLKQKSIPLYLNHRLHLKLYIYDSNTGFHTSGNITGNGLGYSENFNIELGCNVALTNTDWHHVYEIIEGSRQVDDDIYQTYVDYYEKNKNRNEPFPKLTLPKDQAKEYSIYNFPITENPKELWKYYSNKNKSDYTPENIRKYIHDLLIYGMRKEGMAKEAFYDALELGFKSQPFVSTLAMMVKKSKSCRFGTVNDWIHRKCTDVPLPYRWELKDNTRILYNWLDFFYKEIEWSVPGAHSQVIYWVDR